MEPEGHPSGLWLVEACFRGSFCYPHQEYSFLPSHIHIWVQFKSCFQGALLGVPSAFPCLTPASSAETGSEPGVVWMWGIVRHQISPGFPLPHCARGLSQQPPRDTEAACCPWSRHLAIPHHSHSHTFFSGKPFMCGSLPPRMWSTTPASIRRPSCHLLLAFGPLAPLLLFHLLGVGLIYKFNFVTIHPCESTIYAYFSSRPHSLCHELKCQPTTMATRSTSCSHVGVVAEVSTWSQTAWVQISASPLAHYVV